MNKFIIETHITKDDVDIEDSGCAVICHVSDDKADEGIHARIISWSANKNHADIQQFIGHRVRVTLERID
jgi:hypothetical protein